MAHFENHGLMSVYSIKTKTKNWPRLNLLVHATSQKTEEGRVGVQKHSLLKPTFPPVYSIVPALIFSTTDD